MKYLLDTSTCVFFLRGQHDLDIVFKEKGLTNCYISEITVFELRYGAENSADPIRSNKAIDSFLTGISIIPIYNCVNRYAKEKVRLKKEGTPMHDEFDLLIGVTAVENDLVLITDNVRHFKRIRKIVVENWVKRGK